MVPITREQMAKGGRRSGEVRREKSARRREDPLFVVEESLGESLQELVKASRGQGEWKDLPASARLQALLRVIEYGVGKTVTVDKMRPKDVSSEGGGVEEAATLQFE